MAFDTKDDREELADINVTPFIDVMLVLLIVFMVAAPLSTVDVPVNLPTSGAPATERPKAPVWITLTKDGFRLGDAPISAADLPAALATRTGGQTATTLYLRADGSLSYRQLMQALDALRQAGYGNVALVGLDAAP